MVRHAARRDRRRRGQRRVLAETAVANADGGAGRVPRRRKAGLTGRPWTGSAASFAGPSNPPHQRTSPVGGRYDDVRRAARPNHQRPVDHQTTPPDTRSARTKSSLVMLPSSATAAEDTPPGTAAHPIRRRAGRRSTPTAATSLQALRLGDPGRTKPLPKAARNVAVYEIRDPKLSSFIQTGGPYANRAAGQGGDRREECFTSEDNDNEVASSAQKSGMRRSWGHRLFLLR